jgi:DNA-directed RNA polymerase specialized sigma24 family protein
VRALERQGTLRPGTNLRTWLMTVLHNAFIDDQRCSAGRRPNASRTWARRTWPSWAGGVASSTM